MKIYTINRMIIAPNSTEFFENMYIDLEQTFIQVEEDYTDFLNRYQKLVKIDYDDDLKVIYLPQYDPETMIFEEYFNNGIYKKIDDPENIDYILSVIHIELPENANIGTIHST
jgi:hypothetical protein